MLELTKRAVLMAEGVGGSGVVVVMVDGGGEGVVINGERGGDVEVVVMEGGGWVGGLVVDGPEARAEEACTKAK